MRQNQAMSPQPEVFLDIETNRRGEITVIGMITPRHGCIQLVRPEVTAETLLDCLPESGRLFTFYGDRFDLPVISDRLGVDLTDRFESADLWRACRAHGIRGGQKAVEVKIGFARDTRGLGGLDAIWLWERYRDGDDEALGLLLEYNADDLLGMQAIKQFLDDQCCSGQHAGESRASVR